MIDELPEGPESGLGGDEGCDPEETGIPKVEAASVMDELPEEPETDVTVADTCGPADDDGPRKVEAASVTVEFPGGTKLEAASVKL